MLNPLKSVAVYIDGFNLYHAIRNLDDSRLKWLNLQALIRKFIDPKTEVIARVYYFSAFATHLKKPEPVLRHKIFVKALQTTGVRFVEGNFKKKYLSCHQKGRKGLQCPFPRHEEKETDVNIAIYMVRDALLKRFDKFILLTNDTDIVPAIKMAKSHNRHLEIKLLTPPTYSTHRHLRKVIRPGTVSGIIRSQLELCLFPETIRTRDGEIIRIPKAYKKPPTEPAPSPP